MESSAAHSNSYKPKPITELLPDLTGILSRDAIDRLTLTAKKQPRSRPTIAQTRTAEKVFKPRTLAEIKTELLALQPQQFQRHTQTQMTQSTKKKIWNSSVKVDKKIQHTAEAKLKNTNVRKVLNFQPKLVVSNPRMTLATETPKFPKPEMRAKKALHLQANVNVRISGICNIPPTPVEASKPIRSRMTIANKENFACPASVKKVAPAPTPKLKKIPPQNIDTPIFNSSWQPGSDASFLQKEKEIHEVEEKINAIAEEPMLENIAEVSPPVSTPFKEYRSVQEYFNNSSYVEQSAVYNDNTIMCFDKPSVCSENEKKEESVIVSLCEMFLKATVTNSQKADSELDNLLEVEKQTEQSIKMLKKCISVFTESIEAQEKTLLNVRKLIEEKQRENKQSGSDIDKTLVAVKDTPVLDNTVSPEKSPILSRPCSVIKSVRSPSYRIPKKNTCLRKVICKSMPNVSSGVSTPVKDFEGRALNMYMKMKEQMNFLSTPMVSREPRQPDTPTVTSHNLQKQLDKLYGS